MGSSGSGYDRLWDWHIMNVEQATIDDAQEILALQKLAYISEAEIYNDFTIPPLHQTLDEIKAEFADQRFLKFCSDSRITGSVRAYVKEGTCFIGKLIVHPECQNRGIGTKLLEEIENTFDHVTRYELFTGHKSRKNLHLYEKNGYKIFRRQILTEDLTIVFMEKYRN
jgi:ribosomal protein S18 acetylase RimI-like enzyme